LIDLLLCFSELRWLPSHGGWWADEIVDDFFSIATDDQI
jgi:hypothetical protein